ncbi:YcdB/YcdC domain-containing protein [uncultured Brevibacillus sp.]|uniref:YcdB/YcdC domain-containing protein n=1 Tax=uncultured Brevibacillus sp. TaxID=169970 RepID=UPI00259A9A21|nr:YcdB/YcdC domain-containing protein [uncultured Brevibacillus sp.]
MKARSKAATLLLAASVLTVAGAGVKPIIVDAYVEKSSEGTVELPPEVIETLEELQENYLPAIQDLHVNYFGNRSDSYILNLSDQKSAIKAGASLNLVIDSGHNISSLIYTDPYRDSREKPEKQKNYKKAVDFLHKNLWEDYVVATQPMLSSNRGSTRDNLLVVPLYPRLHDVRVWKEVGQVMVDAEGQIVLYRKNEEKLPLETEVVNPKQAIAKDKAEKAFGDELTLELVYDTKSGKLVYTPKNIPIIDALTGEAVPSVTVESSKTLSLKGTADGSSWKDQKKLEQLLVDEFQLAIPTLNFKHVNETSKDRTTDLYQWLNRVYESATIAVDRQSGQFIELKLEGATRDGSDKKWTEAEAEKLAVQFVEKYLLSTEKSFVVKTSRLVDNLPGWVDQNHVQRIFSYQFYPHGNGITTKEPLYTVDVDAKKGKVVMAKVAELSSLPASLAQGKLVDMETAKKAFLKQSNVSLAYWYPKANTQTAKLPQLVYAPTLEMLSTQINAATSEKEESWLEWIE